MWEREKTTEVAAIFCAQINICQYRVYLKQDDQLFYSIIKCLLSWLTLYPTRLSRSPLTGT